MKKTKKRMTLHASLFLAIAVLMLLLPFATAAAQEPPAADLTALRGGFTVCLDAGHGGIDPGAVVALADGTEVREKDLTLLVAQKTADLLRARGYRVCMTREEDSRRSNGGQRDELQERLAYCHTAGADLTLSLHANAYRGEGRAYGARVYYNPASEAATACAEHCAQAISEHTGGMVGRAARTEADGSFLILSDPDLSALLVEMGFLTDEHERSLMCGEEWQSAFANALADAVDRCLLQEAGAPI